MQGGNWTSENLEQLKILIIMEETFSGQFWSVTMLSAILESQPLIEISK